MIEIIPAVLARSWEELESALARTHGVAPRVQVDVVDGRYAKHATWPYGDERRFEALAADEHGLPWWSELDYEFDLMIEDPAAVVLSYAHVGASRVVVHAASASAEGALAKLGELRGEGGASSVEAGVALGVTQDPDDLLKLQTPFDFVQVMGIDREGKQGEVFDPRATLLIERLRHRYPEMSLQVDGGVTLANASQLAAAGATRLVVGSALFGASDLKAAYEALYNEVNGASH